jgi:hypothetical protein
LDEKKRILKTTRVIEQDISTLNSIVKEYRQIESQLKEKPAGEIFNLFSFLEDIAAKSGLMENVDYMRPGNQQLDPQRIEKWVEVKLERITIKQFTEYLYRLQNSGYGIYVKRLSLKKDGEYLDLILQPAVTEAV